MFNAFGEEHVRGKQTKGKEVHEQPVHLYFSPNFIKVISSMNKRRARYVARMRQLRVPEKWYSENLKPLHLDTDNYRLCEVSFFLFIARQPEWA